MVSLRTRAGLMVSNIAFICVLAAAGLVVARTAQAEDAAPPRAEEAAPSTLDLSGRWEGRSYELSKRKDQDCRENRCMMVVDIAKCSTGWCGVEVLGTEQRCGATALKLDGGQQNAGTSTLFKGKLELAAGTEPYVVEAYFVSVGGGDVKAELQITGDTGGEFRMFRRSFPFNATLVRSGDAHCRPESTVSLLD